MKIVFDTTICSGFPVTVEAFIESFDSGDYGHSTCYNSGRKVVEEIEIFKRGTHKSVDFITKRMTDGDWDDLNQEALDEFHNGYED